MFSPVFVVDSWVLTFLVVSVRFFVLVYLFGISLCSVLFPMEPVSLCCPFVFDPSGYLFNVSLCSVLFPMEPVSLGCPFAFVHSVYLFGVSL